jgi:hypothetical protein
LNKNAKRKPSVSWAGKAKKMKTVRRLAGKKGAPDDEQEEIQEALQLAALEASAVVDAGTLSSSPRRQQWLADQKDYSIRMNCVISPFMAEIAAERKLTLSHLFNNRVPTSVYFFRCR